MERAAAFWPLTCAAGAHVTLCEVCERAPAAVTCKADAAMLCATCDADIHAANPLARRHERVPVAPLYGPAATWQKEVAAGADLISFFADADPFLDLDYADSLVPAAGAPPAMVDFPMEKPPYNSYNEHLMSHSLSSSEVGVVPDDAFAAAPTTIADAPNAHSRPIRNPMATMDREARVMRYREKRKNRKFEKTIRYASRKAYAESRPRIKGRFVKRVDADSDADPIYSFPDNGLMLKEQCKSRT